MHIDADGHYTEQDPFAPAPAPACQGCDERKPTRVYRVIGKPGTGGRSLARWCAECADQAAGGWTGDIERIEAL